MAALRSHNAMLRISYALLAALRIWILRCVCMLKRFAQLLLSFFRESSLVNLAPVGLESADDSVGVGRIDRNEKGAVARLELLAELFDEVLIDATVKRAPD